MAIQTGTFDGLGISYEKGNDAALLSAMARSAEELTSGKGWPEGGQRPADRARTGHRGQPGVDISAPGADGHAHHPELYLRVGGRSPVPGQASEPQPVVL